MSAKKLRILKDPSMSAALKKSLVHQLDPKINSLIRRMHQLPSGFSALGKNGDEAGDEIEIEIEEEEDLVTPVQQKLLQRILKNVTPLKRGKVDPIFKEEEVTPIKPRRRKKISKKKLAEQLPFYGEDLPKSDINTSIARTFQRLRKRTAATTPLAVRRLRAAQGWESWDSKERTKRKLSYSKKCLEKLKEREKPNRDREEDEAVLI